MSSASASSTDALKRDSVGSSKARAGSPRSPSLNDARAGMKAGKSSDEVAGAWKIPAKYAGYAAPDPNRLKNNVALAYMELGGK